MADIHPRGNSGFEIKGLYCNILKRQFPLLCRQNCTILRVEGKMPGPLLLFSSKRYRKKRKTGDKEKTNTYMKEYRKKGPDRNRKNITMLT